MARPLPASSHFAATFYIHHQTFNLITTPPLSSDNFAQASFITPRHKIYAFTLFTLLGLLQVQSTGNTPSFQVHPVTAGACVLGILAYYLAFRVRECLPLYAARLNVAMGVFGSFFLAYLVSLLLADSSWYIKYIFYILLIVIELHQVVTVLYDKYVRRFRLTMRRSRLANSTRHLLPLTYADLRE